MSRPSVLIRCATRLAVVASALVLVTAGGVASADPTFSDAHPVSGLATLNADGTAQIDDLSCSSNGNCAAVGTYLDSTKGQQGFVVNEVNDVWGSAQPIPGLIALNVGGFVPGSLTISCTATGECSAGGDFTDATPSLQVFFATEHGGNWGSAAVLPRDTSLPAKLPAGMTAIACSSPGNCVAGGFFVDGAGTAEQTWVDSQTSGTWGNAVELLGTSVLNQGVISTVVSLSCPAAGACAVTGLYVDSSNHLLSYVDQQTSGTWGTAQTVPGLVALNSGGAAGANQISCSAPGQCAIGGLYTLVGGAQEAFVDTEVGGTWQNAIEAPGTLVLNTDGSAQVYSVACPSTGSCEAVGSYQDSTGSYQAFAMSESGGTWGNAFEMPGSAALNAGGAAEAYDVSCVSAGDCRAAGYYTDSSNNYQAFLSTETGGVWSSTVEVPGSAALNTENDGELSVVSCTSDGSCSAGGQYKDSSGYLQVMILDASTAPATAPGTPSAHAASHAKGKVTVTVSDASTGGSPITSYQYSINGGAWRHGSNGAGSFTISHLKSKSKVHIRVRAVNSVGPSGPSHSITVKVR